MDKPHAPACERNREPILEVLHDHFHDRRAVLEIGSGTGQHAIFFAARLPHLIWQSTDLADNLPGIRLWIAEANLPNLRAPLVINTKARVGLQKIMETMLPNITLSNLASAV
jgi:tRNA G46 methylase TrmB